MATLHVIYDEKDKIPPMSPDLCREEGCSYALLSLPTFYSKDEMEEAIRDLALSLLRHHYGHSKDARRRR